MNNILRSFLNSSDTYKCQYCGTNVIKNYCSVCRSHFTIVNNNEQKYLSVEMDDLEFLSISDKLCPLCTRYYKNSKYIIRSTSFSDYFAKLKFCKKCKNDSKKFIRNMFYKNFTLNRRLENVYSSRIILLFFILFHMCGENQIFYYFNILYNWFIYSYSDIVICLIFCLGRNYWFVRGLYLLYSCYILFSRKRYFFYMPVNLEKEENIDKHIKELTI